MGNKSPNEPASLKKAMAKHDWPEWKKAMEIEYNFIIESSTWKIVSLPNKANVIKLKWVFKLKKDCFGNILRYKA